MDKKARIALKYSLIITTIVAGLLLMYFAFAEHTVAPTSYNINDSGLFIFNISINNTDVGQNANITQINITLPSGFSFVVASQGTDAKADFTNTTLLLSWKNFTEILINGTSEIKYFWFSASTAAITPGQYNISVRSLNASSVTNILSNVSVLVNDTTIPSSIEFSTLTPASGVNLSQNFIQGNITATDNGAVTIVVRLFNSTGLNSSSTNATGTTSSYLIFNFTGLSDGVYYLNATANDTYNNKNETATRVITLDTTYPQITFNNSVTEASGVNVSRNWINVSVTASDTNEKNISFRLFNSTGLVNSTTYTTAIRTINWTGLAEGTYSYNISITDYANRVNVTATRTIILDTTAPTINLLTPVNGNSTQQSAVTFTYNVTDAIRTNCTLIANNNFWNFNSAVNINGITNSFVNVSYVVSNTWNVNCTDNANNKANSSIYSFSLLSFKFNGTTNDENGNALNASVVNVTIRSQAGWSVVGYTSITSNSSGWFNFSIASNASWLYELSMIQRNSTTNAVNFRSKTIPAFPSSMMQQFAGAIFYLTPAGTINITAINSSGGRAVFQYQVKDQKLGYPVAEEHSSYVSEVNIYVPRNRNYSIMIYPNQSMPVSFNWNNFSSSSSYTIINNVVGNISSYDAVNFTLHKQFNISMTMANVFGYINYSGINGWQKDNFTVVPFLLEPGNMVHSRYGTMPYNMSGTNPNILTDVFNISTGFYNISLPATAETSNILLIAASINNSVNYGAFRNISLSYGSGDVSMNFTNMSRLLGNPGFLTMEVIDGTAQNKTVPTARQTFLIVNATNSTLTSTSAHIETIVDYSRLGALEFTWMSDIEQAETTASFSLPLLNLTGVKEMNVYVAGGGEQEYAPRKVPTMTPSQIIANSNITVRVFNPGDIDGAVARGSINISLVISNSSCDVPNPVSSCYIGGTNQNMETFNPMRAVMGGGKLSFRMGTGGIIIHYVNVDMLASGPPDALFDNDAGTSESATAFSNALRLGSLGPTVYDYVLVSIPYAEGSATQTGLHENADVNISIPTFYDDNWNAVWSSTNGTNVTALAGNYTHYSARQEEWQILMQQNNCSTTATLNSTTPCHIDKTNNRIWVRLPHFSGTGPSVTGSLVTASSSTSTSGGGGAAATGFWTTTYTASETQLQAGYTKTLSAKERLNVKVSGADHYVGVVSLTSSSVIINISSTPQQATFYVGDEKKFEVTNDNYYDIYVKLNSITSSRANITIKSIHELIPTTTQPTTPTEEKEEKEGEEGAAEAEVSKKTWLWAVLGLIGAVIIIAVIFFIYRKKRY